MENPLSLLDNGCNLLMEHENAISIPEHLDAVLICDSENEKI